MSDSEEDFNDASYTNTLFKPSFVLFAIDTSPLMFTKRENDPTPFRTCINTCYNLANELIFTQNKRSWSPFGIVLAREDASASFVNFNDNVLDSIKFLKEKKDMTDDDLESMYQRKNDLALSSFFLFCKKKFKEVNAVFYKRIIIFITNDDNPCKNDTNQRFAALNEAKNFEANGITFEMITLHISFDYKLFYNELFSVMKTPLIETLVEDEEGLLDKLSSSVLTRFYQRKVHFFPFVDDETRFLKVRQKAFIREEKMYDNAFVDKNGKTLQKVSKETADVAQGYIFDDTEDPDLPEFDMEDYIEIVKNDLPIGYTLLHVADRVTDLGSILIDNVILEVDPKEELSHFFNSFWQYCVDKKKVLVCARKLRESDKLRFVEFVPKFANHNKVFMIKGIPFHDEQECLGTSDEAQDPETTEYSNEQIEATNELVNKLTYDYDPKMFTDPVSAKRKAFLRSKLLDEPKEDVEDVTLDENGIDESLGKIGEDFKQLFCLEEEEKGTKRKTTASERSKRKK